MFNRLIKIVIIVGILLGTSAFILYFTNKKKYEKFDTLTKPVFYVDLTDSAYAKTFLVHVINITSVLDCIYILSTDQKDTDINNIVKKYGNVIYKDSYKKIKKMIDSNKNNYLFFCVSNRYGQKYKTDVKPRGNYIFLSHGFDNWFWNADEISPQHKLIEGLHNIGDDHRYYFYRYNNYETKLYNLLLSTEVEKLSKLLDKSIWPTGKPILGILQQRKFDFSKHINDFKELSQKYTIVIRKHASIALPINGMIKQLNFIEDTNQIFIPLCQKSDIMISIGLTSCLDSYFLSLQKCTPLLLIYDKDHYYDKNHKSLMNTNRIVNNRCCSIQVEGEVDILKGVYDALRMDKKEVLKNRSKYIDEYFYPQRKDANKHFVKNILQYYNIENVQL